jgi:hypothetical protein
MAFLLSPKTGGGDSQTYLFFSGDTLVSINGGEEAAHGEKNPAEISSGDVLTWASRPQDTAISYESDADGSTIKLVRANSPYTVEAVPGADTVYLTVEES